MWSSEKQGWRAVVVATWCASLLVQVGGAGAQPAAGLLPALEPEPGFADCRGSLAAAASVSTAHPCEVDDGMQIASAESLPSNARGFQPAPVADATFIMVAQGAEGGTVDVPAGAAERTGDAVAAAAPGGPGWGLPPVRWGGSLITELRAEQVGEQPRRLQRNETANIRASSYVWQPWFALVSGGLGFLTSKERYGDGGEAAVSQVRNSSSSAVTANGEATLFPVSRFPFNAYFDVSDSRASGELTTGDYTNTRFGLRQNYRPVEGNANYAATFNRSTLESPAFGRDTVNALAASMNRSAGPQAFDISGSSTRNTRSNTGERTALNQLSARHSYRPEPELSVESLASASGSDFHLISAGVPVDNRSRFAQANTFAAWRPEEGSPLYVTGGGRMFRSVIAGNTGDAESLTLGGNLAASYALSRQTTVSGSAMVTQLLSDATDSLLTTQAASVTHIGDPVGILGFGYTWNAGGNIANQTGLAEGNQKNVGGQFGHNLTRSLALGEGSQLSFGLGQGVGTLYDSVTASSQTLSHNGNVSWRLTRNAATSTYMSLLGADSRTSGHNENHFQLINFQASGQAQFSNVASAAANLTVQGVRQRTSTTPGTGFDINSSGNLSYYHLRVFDVPRLRYTALYTVNDSQYKTRLQGDVNAPRERVSQSFEQRLDYNVGRVAMRLSLRIAEIEGRRDMLVFFRMSREFGGF